ncbi:MAG: spermidine/putrescine ABC transporter substrate-binding protein [Opitutales bacterium]|nr:spermidine/putrescine ABC transporter substrate-binding protein [Opitutales bacterium]
MKSTHRSLLGGLGLAAAALFFSACGKSKPELHIYNWSDYFAEETLAAFEEKYDCHVIYDVFESNEAMYAKLKAGASGYDVVFPSSYQAILMHNENMVEELDHSKLSNLKNIDPKFLKIVALDKGMTYSVPYMSGTTGIAVLTDNVGEYEESWDIYLREDLKGRVTLLNDYREVLGAALKKLGYSLNTTNPEEVAEAGELVKVWKANIAKFASDEYKPGIASGEFYAVHGYSGDIMQVMEEAEEGAIEYFLPEEGFSFWADDMVIMKDAQNKDLAYAFIDYMLDAQTAANNMEFTCYWAPNSAAYELISEELRANPMVFLSDEHLEKGEQIAPLGEKDQIYMDVWAQVKSQE